MLQYNDNNTQKLSGIRCDAFKGRGMLGKTKGALLEKLACDPGGLDQSDQQLKRQSGFKKGKKRKCIP